MVCYSAALSADRWDASVAAEKVVQKGSEKDVEEVDR